MMAALRLLLPALALAPRTSARLFLTVDPDAAEPAAGARVTLGPVTKSPHNPLLQEDKEWEAAWWNTNPSVFHKDGAYHWYYTSNIVCSGRRMGMCPHAGWEGPPETRGPRTGLLYANSTDGLTWTKPALGMVAAPPHDSTANNIVLATALGNGVFYDDRAGLYRQFGRAPAAHCPPGDKASQLGVSSSVDGLHWENCTSAAAMACQGDTSNNALWDEDLQQYLAFTRIDVGGASAKALGGRREGRSVSDDWRSWSKAEEVLHGEANCKSRARRLLMSADLKRLPTDESYALVPFKPAAGSRPGLYFGLGMFYNITSGGSTAWNTSADRGKVYCELLMSTTHGANWTRLAPGRAYIPHGGPGSPDSHT